MKIWITDMETKRTSCEIEAMLPQAKEFSETRGKAWIRAFPSEGATTSSWNSSLQNCGQRVFCFKATQFVILC